jgi:hypothetical protein
MKIPITLRDPRRPMPIEEARQVLREHGSITNAPWITALEKRNECIRGLVNAVENVKKLPPDERRLHDLGWETELAIFRLSEPYSFSGSALEAIKAASRSIPGDATLEAENLPADGIGWWWLDDPLRVKTSSESDLVAGILFGLSMDVDKEMLKGARELANGDLNLEGPQNVSVDFSCWTKGKDGTLSPSTTWAWRVGLSLDEMIENVGDAYDHTYASENPFRHAPLLGKAQTLAAIREMSQFFVASSIWIKQEIVEAAPQHVERHLAKRMQREGKLPNKATVKVIALRRKHVQHGAEEDMKSEGGEARDWSCQWVVSGHWRNQPVGPGRTARKLTYINPFIKGPEGKPLKPEQKKVYAVMR